MGRLLELLDERNRTALEAARAQNELDTFLAGAALAVAEASGHIVQRSELPRALQIEVFERRGPRPNAPDSFTVRT